VSDMPHEHDSEIWWRWIVGPQRMLFSLVSLMREHRHVVVDTVGGLPWREDFAGLARDQLQADGLYVEALDATRFADAGDLGRALIDGLLPGAAAMAYRGTTPAQAVAYLRQQSVFRDKVFWVRGLDAARLPRWLSLCRLWKSNGHDGLFALEADGAALPEQLPVHIAALKPRHMITGHDMQLFCSLLSSQLAVSDLWKQYIALVTARICPENAEAAAALLREIDFLADDFADRAETLLPGSLRQRDIWHAQIQVVFPLIESAQSAYVEAYYPELERALAQAGEAAIRFGQRVSNPYDVDLGLMLHLANQPSGEGKLLYLPDGDYARIHFLRDRRNDLAHMQPCTVAQLHRIFDGRLLPEVL